MEVALYAPKENAHALSEIPLQKGSVRMKPQASLVLHINKSTYGHVALVIFMRSFLSKMTGVTAHAATITR